jgi:uncharacterized protein (DUF169 family)
MTEFEPDLVLIYSNTAQLRSLLLAAKYTEGSLVRSQFDPINSCLYAIVPVLDTGEYRITIPDPGEYERAMAGEDEIIFSVPKEKLTGLIQGLGHFEKRGMGYTQLAMEMKFDFPRPPFYKDLFQMWDLDVEE